MYAVLRNLLKNYKFTLALVHCICNWNSPHTHTHTVNGVSLRCLPGSCTSRQRLEFPASSCWLVCCITLRHPLCTWTIVLSRLKATSNCQTAAIPFARATLRLGCYFLIIVFFSLVFIFVLKFVIYFCCIFFFVFFLVLFKNCNACAVLNFHDSFIFYFYFFLLLLFMKLFMYTCINLYWFFFFWVLWKRMSNLFMCVWSYSIYGIYRIVVCIPPTETLPILYYILLVVCSCGYNAAIQGHLQARYAQKYFVHDSARNK